MASVSREAGDTAEARMRVVNEARKRGFVTTAQRFDHAPRHRDRRASSIVRLLDMCSNR